MPQNRITPDNITDLHANEVFVFGSNIHGLHGGGAARFAYEHFGAEWGVGEGRTGQCYALPTMEGPDSFRLAVRRFTEWAKQDHEHLYLVTPVGCGIAGYSAAQVAPWFADAATLDNVSIPESFWRVLGH